MLIPVSTSSGWPSPSRRRASASTRSSGRLSAAPRVVGMMQNAQRESHPFCTFRKARVRPGARGASSAQAPGRPPPRMLHDLLRGAVGGAGHVVTDGPANWPASRFTAQPDTNTRPRRAPRLASRRLLRSASTVSAQVLTTCTSAASGAVSTCPASRRASRMSAASAWLTLQPRNRTEKRVAVLTRPPPRGRRRPRAPGTRPRGRPSRRAGWRAPSRHTVQARRAGGGDLTLAEPGLRAHHQAHARPVRPPGR